VSLAIMPFVTQGGSGIDYVGTGLSSALADSLAPLSGLKITASTSTQALAGKGLTAPDIAKRLAISHLVEGNVQQTGKRFSISVRLIDAGTSEQIWTRTLEGPDSDLQRLKNSVARELAGALRARLGVGEGEVVERRDVDPRAYEAYLKALERLSVRHHPGARLEAIKQFRLASTIQPDFADAHAGHAYLLSLTSPYALGMTWNELAAVQRRAASRALELDPNNALGLVAQASALHNFEGEIDRATAIAQAVLKRSPSSAPAHYTLSGSLWMRGQAREALHHLDVAIEQDPLDSILRYYRAKILYSMGDYGGVRDAAQSCPDPCVGIAWVWFRAMLGHGTEGDYREDYPSIEERVRGDVSPQELAESRSVAEAFIFGRPMKLTPLKDERFIDFIEAALEARNGNFEEALRLARTAADRHQPDNVLEILNEGRLTFTPEQRADPRYHALFRHPKLIRLATARRKGGVTAGLPVFPVKPYTGR
jgi:TolB-like protein